MSESFAELFESSISKSHMQPGGLVVGEVVHVDDQVVVVNAGLKTEGIIPAEQFRDASGALNVKGGDRVEVVVENVEDGFGETRLSREKACRAKAWVTLEKAAAELSIVTGVIPSVLRPALTTTT